MTPEKLPKYKLSNDNDDHCSPSSPLLIEQDSHVYQNHQANAVPGVALTVSENEYDSLVDPSNMDQYNSKIYKVAPVYYRLPDEYSPSSCSDNNSNSQVTPSTPPPSYIDIEMQPLTETEESLPQDAGKRVPGRKSAKRERNITTSLHILMASFVVGIIFLFGLIIILTQKRVHKDTTEMERKILDIDQLGNIGDLKVDFEGNLLTASELRAISKKCNSSKWLLVEVPGQPDETETESRDLI